MGQFVAGKVIKLLIGKGHDIYNSRVLILGITFKENCTDVRNSKVVDIYNELKEFGVDVDVYDPWASAERVKKEYNIDLVGDTNQVYDAIILAVAHTAFAALDFAAIKKGNRSVIYDTKSFLNRLLVDARL